ncbi:MAG TPA: MFS transporter [Solirubrobacteraceae bacterium]|nr:MFS transporter [Solirubrobacteraceae bacterium]
MGPRERPGAASLLLALAVGLVLADSSVVTLALPAILREFDSSVNAVAWVLIAFNLALALLALAGSRVARGRAREALAIALALFAAASLACAAAPSLGALIAARTAQGVIGAVVVAAALERLVALNGRGRAVALWAAAGVLGSAVGPALGGFLTETFSWQAMFALQAPVALVTILGVRGVGPAAVVIEAPAGGDRPAIAPLVALALASAALSAALFLLVIMLIEGWRHSPGEAAVTVTVMPLAAIAAGRWARRRHDLVPALGGCVLVAGGLAALGLLPGADLVWTIAPQLAIGAGLGLALATLIGATVGATGPVARPAAWTISARHLGIVVGLLVLTPIFTADLRHVRAPGEDAGLARLLDAPLPLTAKLALARTLDREITGGADQALPDVGRAFAAVDVPAASRPALARLHARLDDELDRAATQAFSNAFLAGALLAALAAVAVAVALAAGRDRARPRGDPSSNGSPLPSGAPLNVVVPAAAAVAALLVAAYVLLGGGGFGPTKLADPCAPRARPAVERTQRVALAALDGTACRLRTSREELVRGLLAGAAPPGVSTGELTVALGDGIDRAQREGALSGLAAAALRVVLNVSGALGLIGRLLGSL